MNGQAAASLGQASKPRPRTGSAAPREHSQITAEFNDELNVATASWPNASACWHRDALRSRHRAYGPLPAVTPSCLRWHPPPAGLRSPRPTRYALMSRGSESCSWKSAMHTYQLQGVMPVPRRKQFVPSNPPWVHCISRCIRRAFLAGQDHDGRDVEHRKRWIKHRLRLLSQAAAFDVEALVVLSNHIHIVGRIRQDRARTWSAREVVCRWLMSICPRGPSLASPWPGRPEGGQGEPPLIAYSASRSSAMLRGVRWSRSDCFKTPRSRRSRSFGVTCCR